MNTIATALTAANTAADRAAHARVWEGKTETRIYIRRWNGSRGRPWIDAGYLRIRADGTVADYRAERTLDYRDDAVEAMADRIAADLAAEAAPTALGAVDRRAIMQRAWFIARIAVKNFGGTARQYLSGALTQAWAEARA